MPRPATMLPIPPKELLDMQGRLPPYGSMLWQGDAGNILVARIPGKDPDLVNDVEKVAEWASPREVLDAQACIMLTAGRMHTFPMAPLRSHVERRLAMDRRQATLLRQQLPAGLSCKLYRAVDDPYRRVRLGVRFPDDRMRDVDDDRLDELAVEMGALLHDGALDDVHCVHLVSAQDDVRLATDAFLADMLPRIQDSRRRVDAQERLLKRQHDDAVARGEETESLRRHLTGGRGAMVANVKTVQGRDEVEWEEGDDGPLADLHSQIDRALGHNKDQASTPADNAMSRLRRHLMDAGYDLRVKPSVPGHSIDLAAERADAPEKLLAWSVARLDRDVAERALSATRDLGADLALIVAPEADADGQRVLVATRVRWVSPDRIEGLRL